jgi:hypothetical protein
MGYFKKEKLSLLDQRVVSLALGRHIQLPKKLHHYNATPLQYYQHDATYHLFIDSANIHRGAWIELATHFKQLGNTQLAEFLFDGELIQYRNLIHEEPETKQDHEVFWNNLISVIYLRCDHIDEATKIIAQFWHYYSNHLEKWAIDHRLTKEDLCSFLIEKKTNTAIDATETLVDKEALISILAKHAMPQVN